MRPLTNKTIFGIRLAIVVLACYWLLIFVGTHLPTIHDFTPRINDKVKHFTAFFGLATLLCYCSGTPVSTTFYCVRRFATIVFLCGVYGGFDEISQGLVKGRTPDWYDFAADLTGTLAAVGSYIVAKMVAERTTWISRMIESKWTPPEKAG